MDSWIDSLLVIMFTERDYIQLYIFSVRFGILKKIGIVFVGCSLLVRDMKKIIMFVLLVITIILFSVCS